MFTAGGVKIGDGQQTSALPGQGAHGFGQGDARSGGRIPRKTSERGGGLKMQAAHRGAQLQGRAQQIAQFVQIDAPDHGGHQHHAQARPGAGLHSPQFVVQAGPAAQSPVHVVIRPVKLQVYRIKPGFGQGAHVARVAPQAQTVAVDLKKAKPLRRAKPDQERANRPAVWVRRRKAAHCTRPRLPTGGPAGSPAVPNPDRA